MLKIHSKDVLICVIKDKRGTSLAEQYLVLGKVDFDNNLRSPLWSWVHAMWDAWIYFTDTTLASEN